MDNNEFKSVDEILDKYRQVRSKFIKNLEIEEQKDTIETENAILNKIKLEREQSLKYKNNFIEEIRSGLGEEIKKNPNDIKTIKKPFYKKFIEKIKKTLGT
jgi:hypothetical protein